MTSLFQLEIDRAASFEGLNASAHTFARRLEDLGFLPGVTLRVLKKLPFGGPCMVHIADSVYSIEKKLATQILVKLQD